MIESLGLCRRGSRAGKHKHRRRARSVSNDAPRADSDVTQGIPVIIGVRRATMYVARPEMARVLRQVTTTKVLHTERSDTQTLPTIYLLNPTSLAKPNALQQITADVLSYCADVVVITESWLKQRHTDEAFSIPGFDTFRRDHPRRRGGGITIYARSSTCIGASVCFHSDDDRLVLLWIQMNCCGNNIVVGALYHPPKPVYKEVELVDELQRVSGLILAEPDDKLIILAGDFNQLSDTVMTQLGFLYVFKCATHLGHSLDRIYATQMLQYQSRAVTSTISTKH